MDTYQAVYDATRQSLRCDPQSAISEAAFSQFDISHIKQMAQEQVGILGYEWSRPCVLFRPTISQDGNAWLAILGDLPTGVVGVGDSPAAAMEDFDKNWHKKA